MKRFMKKVPLPLLIGAVAVLACVIVLICIFSGDKKENSEPVIPTQGSVILNAGAAVQIDYSESGNVAKLTGINGAGSILLEQLTDYVNTPTTDLVTRLLTAAKENNYLGEGSLVVLRQTKGSPLPQKTGFLPDLRDHIQNQLGKDHQVILITVAELNEDNLIDSKTAQMLARLYVKDEQAKVSCDDQIRNDCYGMYIITEESMTFYRVNALTGEISESDPMEFYAGEEETFPSDPEETMPEDFFGNMDGYYDEPPFIEEETFPTEIEDTIPTEAEDTLPQEETVIPNE